MAASDSAPGLSRFAWSPQHRQGHGSLGSGGAAAWGHRADGTLTITDRDQRIELYPESPTRFFGVVEETTVEFVTGADGGVTHVMIDGRIKAPRVGE